MDSPIVTRPVLPSGCFKRRDPVSQYEKIYTSGAGGGAGEGWDGPMGDGASARNTSENVKRGQTYYVYDEQQK